MKHVHGLNQEERASFDAWLARLTRMEREMVEVKALQQDVHARLERLMARYLPAPRVHSSNGAHA